MKSVRSTRPFTHILLCRVGTRADAHQEQRCDHNPSRENTEKYQPPSNYIQSNNCPDTNFDKPSIRYQEDEGQKLADTQKLQNLA